MSNSEVLSIVIITIVSGLVGFVLGATYG